MNDDTPASSGPDRPKGKLPKPEPRGPQVVEVREGEEVTFGVKVQFLREPPDATAAKLDVIITGVGTLAARVVAIDEQQRDLRTQGETLQSRQARTEGRLQAVAFVKNRVVRRPWGA